GIEGNNDDLSAMVRLRYNLYKGGADKARRQETAERLNVAKEEVRRMRRLIEREVRLAVNSLITTQNRVNYVAEHVKATEEVLDSYKEQHKLGQRSLLDVLDSENELFNARSAQVTVNYTEILSLFRILASMGLLLETLAIEEVTH
ncbi:MAG: TolC family protein, partial [Pseudomonadota bacterium]|nr:TolC family protein [Pseudomonadota bacterium]